MDAANLNSTEALTPIHGHDPDEVGTVPAAPRTRAWAIGLVALVFSVVFGSLFLLGWIPRLEQNQVLAREVNRLQTELPKVRAELPRSVPRLNNIVLPGDMEAMQEVAILARIGGYIRERHVDIGQRVKTGDLLAVIDTPEVDAQVLQAQATLIESEAALESSQATARLGESTVKRLRLLVPQNAASQQSLENAEEAVAVANAKVKVATATIEVNKANLKRITELQDFGRLVAPFDGTITERGVEVGQLAAPGNGGGNAATDTPLFRLARTNPVRVFVDVPQVYASSVAVGLEAEILVREIPDRTFVGKVVRTAGAIEPRTRTLRTEIHIPNADGALLTGSFVQVRLPVERAKPPLLVAASSLIVNASGMHVAVVDAHNKIELRTVTVDGDFGSDVGIATGITADELVVKNPGDRLDTGVEVQVEKLTAASSATPTPVVKLDRAVRLN